MSAGTRATAGCAPWVSGEFPGQWGAWALRPGACEPGRVRLRRFTPTREVCDISWPLTTSLTRSPDLARASSRIDASWTFTSEKTARDTKLPVSTVRFAAPFLGLDSTAPAGRRATVRVTVQGAAAGGNLGSLTVHVSDDGRTWTEVALRKGAFTHRTPAAGKSVSLRAEVTDKQGNTSKVTIHDAYAGR